MTSEFVDFKPIEIADLKKQNYQEIKKKLEKDNETFEDPLFPKSLSSIGQTDESPELKNVKWMRAKDIAGKLEKKAVLFSNGPRRCDINQGSIGDCWFLATLANLPSQVRLFEKVVPTDQAVKMDDSPGIFYFRFWQYGEWVDVVVDDYLPTLQDQPCFLKSDTPNEFWPAMIEKAYAKLYGNYTLALNGGMIGSSMEDLTGGLAESYETRNPAPFKVMLKAYEAGSMMGAAIWGRPGETREQIHETGLASGHAYSVTKVVEFEANGKTVQLVRVRNPWGNFVEWKGAWSDKSSEWDALSEAEKFKIGLREKADGEFFMTYEDFNKQFDALDICHVARDSFNQDGIGWHKEEVHGSWVKGTEIFHENPQYLVDLKDHKVDADNLCTFIVSLIQKGGRRKRADGHGFETAFDPIGLVVINAQDVELPLSSDYINEQVNNKKAKIAYPAPFRANTVRMEVPPGKYVVLPFTVETNKDLKFMLRLFTEMPAILKLIN